MTKEKKYNIYAVAASSLVAVCIYLIFKLGYLGEIGGILAKSLFVGSLGLSAVLILLLLFNGKIFISWLKYIALWYLPLTVWFVSLPNNDPWYGKIEWTTILMTTLFIITLIYALVMTFVLKRKQKNQ